MSKKTKALKTKTDIISKMAKTKGIPLNVASHFVNGIIDEISSALAKDQRVEIRGFGCWKVKKYKSYKGKNPKDQTKITVRAKRRPRFKQGVFKKILNQTKRQVRK